MNLLGAKLYDPGTAVTASAASLLAMTALDTTNLRITFTVPSHGYVRVRMKGTTHGATTQPTVLLGVLEGATIRGRVSPMNLDGTASGVSPSSGQVGIEADFVISGLSPGSVSWDAAYGVEVVVASSGIKYGGPDDTTTNNAWGGFQFEIWDPMPNPTNFSLLSINGSGQVDAIKLAGQTITAAAGVTFPASVASPTNITAGTITTVTNLTNAPTAGDLTAAMKASVTTAADASMSTTTYAEPGQGAPAATTSLAAKIGYLYKAWRNNTTQTSTTYKLYADDTTTVDQKATVSDDATTFTRGEIATGP